MTNENVKKLIEENGSQSAAVLMNLINRIEALEAGSGGGIVGRKGSILIADGEGGIAADEDLTINMLGINAYKPIYAEKGVFGVSDQGDISTQAYVSAGKGLIVGNDDEKGRTINMVSPNGTFYAISVNDSGELVVTKV